MPITSTEDPLGIVMRCDGFYECPRNNAGKRSGPLVGYAGKSKKNGRQLVGDVYVNFAKVEEHPHIVRSFSDRLRLKMGDRFDDIDVFCGLPIGGLALGYQMALETGKGYIFPEKVVTQAKTETAREESELVFSRHAPRPKQKVVIVEDVANNFSTTEKSLLLIEEHGAIPVGMVCFLNRSPFVEDVYHRPSGGELPVIALVRKAIPEYDDDDPEVAEDIARGNIVRKPKNDWEPLRTLMQQRWS